MSDEIVPLSPGISAPLFSLPDVRTGQTVSLADYAGQLVVVNFWSPECPWSNYYDPYWNQRAPVWAEQGIGLIQINSNANETVDELVMMANEFGLIGPVLRDEGNVVADSYGATNTPHIYVVGGDGLLVYTGAIDDRNFRQKEPTINYLDAALENLLAGQFPSPDQTPAYGCTIVRDFD